MTEADVREALRDVLDPELGVNIVDLGLVYDVTVEGETAVVTMTMTTPACPLRDYLQSVVESEVLARVPDARSVTVHVVDDPPWNQAMMSDAARAQLG